MFAFLGFLPWQNLHPLQHHILIADFKRFCRGSGRADFLKNCPYEFNNIFDIIIKMG